MLVDPVSLIRETVEKLELLSVFLSDESDARVHDITRLRPEVANCKAAANLCNALLPCLKNAADHIRESHAVEMSFSGSGQRASANCDEFKELM